ncbi:MAG: radical SAM protein [Bacteroidetes bacterium]|nr:MAG: radical SAM protein [Bacteroidota bacterium]
MYKYLFGPVPSRRLGMSLGIDLVPFKVCSLDCVYCECGSTTKLTTERKEYILFDKLKAELEHYFARNPDPDYMTFSGSGEPTLNSRIGDVIDFLKKIKPDIPIAVLTNGTLLSSKKLRKELLFADVVLPSMDAALNASFQKLNRPHPSLQLDEYIKGLIDFRKEFSGKIWLEVFILPGYNNGEKDLLFLKDAIEQISPDSVQLNTLDRPGVVEDLRPATYTELTGIANFLGLDHVEVIAAAPKRKEVKSYREDMETAILETIARRPCTLDDLSGILGAHINEINKYLGVLEKENKITTSVQARGVFYILPKHAER